jgi:hypothetical protein
MKTVIPSTREAETGRIVVRTTQAKSKQDPISINNLGMLVHTCDPNYAGGCRLEDFGPRLAPDKKQETLSEKYLKAKSGTATVWQLQGQGQTPVLSHTHTHTHTHTHKYGESGSKK